MDIMLKTPHTFGVRKKLLRRRPANLASSANGTVQTKAHAASNLAKVESITANVTAPSEAVVQSPKVGPSASEKLTVSIMISMDSVDFTKDRAHVAISSSKDRKKLLRLKQPLDFEAAYCALMQIVSAPGSPDETQRIVTRFRTERPAT